MKRIPLLLALSTAIFLIICFIQIRGRGMGLAPPETDWELHPGVWWHFNFLADCGEFLIESPAFFIIVVQVLVMSFFSVNPVSSPVANLVLTYFPIAVPIIIESLLIYYVAKFIGSNNRGQS